MRKGNAKQKILSTAISLFYQKGIKVGIDEIIQQSDVSRMTLYKHFPSKDDLIEEVVRQGGNDWLDWFKKSIEKKASSPEEKIQAVFDVLKEWYYSESFRGCGGINIATELADTNHAAHKEAAKRKLRILFFLKNLLSDTNIENPSDTAKQLLLLIDGATVNAYLLGSPEPFEQAYEVAKRLCRQRKARST